MSVYRRKSGRWAVLVDVGRGVDKKRKRRTQGTYATRKEAERAERQALDTRDRGIELDPEKVSFADVAERFLKSIVPDLSRITVARYEEHWRMHAAPRLEVFQSRLKPAHLVELYTKLRTERVRYRKKTKSRACRRTVSRRPPTRAERRFASRFLHRFLGGQSE